MTGVPAAGLFRKLTLVNGLFAVACVCLVAGYAYLKSGLGDSVFSNNGFMPHGHCYLWAPSLVVTMLVSDLLIGLAYVSISVCLYVLVRRIRLPFSAIFLAFGVFIAACGATHFMEVYTLWYPAYWFAALVKVITAIASVATALIMFPLFPKVVEFTAAARLSEERRKQLETMNQQLGVANEMLEARSQELIASNRELETFSYSVSHDLRSPLRSIDGFSGILLEDYSGSLDAKAGQYLGNIRQSAQRMGKIIDDLLSLAQLSRAQVDRREVNLSAFAKEAVTSLRTQEPSRSVEVFVQEGVVVQGDPGLLSLVLQNLLSNAWKFTGKAVGARIEFGAQKEAEGTVFFVRDNGAGFDMAFAAKLFGPFERLHSASEFPGTGIGLATARRVIEKHGGRIWADSSPGKGTSFYFTVGSGQ